MLICVDDKFNKLIVAFRGESADYEFFEAVFKGYQYCKKVTKKHLNKKLIMSEDEEDQWRNARWICKKTIDDDDEQVRNHCHVTEKFRDASHWSCIY